MWKGRSELVKERVFLRDLAAFKKNWNKGYVESLVIKRELDQAYAFNTVKLLSLYSPKLDT